MTDGGMENTWPLSELMDLYQSMDQESAGFQHASHLACLTGCGQCCSNPQVEATPFEMFPLALHLFQEGQALDWLDRLEETPEEKPCLLFQSHPDGEGKGRCGAYSFRPTLCRLFGFAALLDKHGKRRVSVCKLIKHNQKEDYQNLLQDDLKKLDQAPLLPHWQSRVDALNPSGVLNQKMPINKALTAALTKVGLYLSFSAPSPADH